MNRKPVSYFQTDPRWKNNDYSAKGETKTIGSAGCGPTCAAMLLATMVDAEISPADTAAWALKNGYKALNQGTYYTYFKAQFAAHGIDCMQLNNNSIYGNPGSAVHETAFSLLKEGCYLIAVMGPGLWTSGGHYVVVWWQDNKMQILDPASTKDTRTSGDIATFKEQVKYYWAVDARQFNAEEDMDQTKFNEMFKAAMREYRGELRDNDSGEWSEAAREWAVANGIFAGSDAPLPDGKPNYMWEDMITREAVAVLLYRLAQKNGLA